MAAIASVLNLMAVFTMIMMSTSCAYDFYVGGRDGWVQKPSENFNQWAERSRFQVNDKLVFKYRKGDDSVLVVSEADYRACSTSNPIQRLDGGDSVFQFDRSGPFFFISGDPGRCQSGQKLIVVVLAARGPKSTSSPPPVATPAPFPSPPSATPLPSPPSAAPLPSPPSAAPLPSPTAAPVTSPTTSPSAAPTPSATAAPTPSATAAPTPSPSAAPTPSATAAPSPSPSAAPSPATSPAPSPAALSPAPSPSETLSTPSPAPTAQLLPPSFSPTEGPSSEVPSAAVPSPSSEVASTPGPSPSASSYAGASLWTVAVALALGVAAFLPW